MLSTINRLHSAVAAVCPVAGVARDEHGTVRIDFADEATAPQRSAALAAAAAFDWSDAAHQAWLADREPEQKDLIDAAAQAIADNDAFLAITSPNNAQMVAQVRRLTQQNTRVIRRLVKIA